MSNPEFPQLNLDPLDQAPEYEDELAYQTYFDKEGMPTDLEEASERTYDYSLRDEQSFSEVTVAAQDVLSPASSRRDPSSNLEHAKDQVASGERNGLIPMSRELTSEVLSRPVPTESSSNTRHEEIDEKKLGSLLEDITFASSRHATLLKAESEIKKIKADGHDIGMDKMRERGIIPPSEFWGTDETGKVVNESGMAFKLSAKLADLIKQNPRYADRIQAHIAVLEGHTAATDAQVRSAALNYREADAEANAAHAYAEQAKAEGLKHKRYPLEKPAHPGEKATPAQKAEYKAESEAYDAENRGLRRLLNRRRILINETARKQRKISQEHAKVQAHNNELDARPIEAARTRLTADDELLVYSNERSFMAYKDKLGIYSLKEVLKTAGEIADKAYSVEAIRDTKDRTGEPLGDRQERYTSAAGNLANTFSETTSEDLTYPTSDRFKAHQYMGRMEDYLGKVDTAIEQVSSDERRKQLTGERSEALEDYIKVRYRHEHLRILSGYDRQKHGEEGFDAARPRPYFTEDGGIAIGRERQVIYPDGSYSVLQNEGTPGVRTNPDGSAWVKPPAESIELDDIEDISDLSMADLEIKQKKAMENWFLNRDQKHAIKADIINAELEKRHREAGDPRSIEKANKLRYWSDNLSSALSDFSDKAIQPTGIARKVQNLYGTTGVWSRYSDGSCILQEQDDEGNWNITQERDPRGQLVTRR